MDRLLLLGLFIIFYSRLCVSYDSESIQIIETIDGRHGTKVLHYKGGSVMKDILTAADVTDLPILVYSVTGKTRGGKSFLLNLMYKYLDSEGKSDWTNGTVPNVFDFKDGVDSMTKGLWLCTRIFKRTDKQGSKVGIMLMDNQGLFDGEVTGGESVAMSGVSTILSHVQMFNMKEKITTNDLEQIMLHLVPQNVEDKASDHSTIGSSLMFVVRDFMGKKRYGYGLSNGENYIRDEQKRGTKEYQSLWADQRSVFNKIECILLPHPGLAVMTEEFTNSPTLKALDNEFVSEVAKFIQELFLPGKLVPHTGVLTGQKMHDTLMKLEGKLADGNLSYYNMFVDRTNTIIMQGAVANFSSKADTSSDIYKTKDYMDETVQTTKFKGHSAKQYATNLKLALQGMLNTRVAKHLVGVYTTTTVSGDIQSRHRDIWPKVITDLRLLVGSKAELDQMKEQIIRDMASIYYTKLGLEEGSKFKKFSETSVPQLFYDKMLALKQPAGLNAFAQSTIKPCEDFARTGVSGKMLNDILEKQQVQFGTSVKSNILRNMFKVKEYFVNNYKNHIKNQNVKVENAILWPKYKQNIDSLQFETETEKKETTQAINKDIGEIYYRLLRDETYNTLKSDWKALNNEGLRDKYQMYKDDGPLKAMLVGKFPMYNQFNFHGHNEMWQRELDVLEKYVQLLIFEELKTRGYEEEATSFWDKYGSAIITAGLAILGGILG